MDNAILSFFMNVCITEIFQLLQPGIYNHFLNKKWLKAQF